MYYYVPVRNNEVIIEKNFENGDHTIRDSLRVSPSIIVGQILYKNDNQTEYKTDFEAFVRFMTIGNKIIVLQFMDLNLYGFYRRP